MTLQEKIDKGLRELTTGSPLYKETWVEKITPGGRKYPEHKASKAKDGTWATPNASQHNYSEDPAQFLARQQKRKKDGKSAFSVPLGVQAQMAGWGTPVAFGDNYKSKVGTSRSKGQEDWRIGNQARLASPETKGKLNPELCRWLMGFPRGWSERAPKEKRKKKTTAS